MVALLPCSIGRRYVADSTSPTKKGGTMRAIRCEDCGMGMAHVWSDPAQAWVCEDCSYTNDLTEIAVHYAH